MTKQFDGVIFALDFDGTVVEHSYPLIGRELPHCIRTLLWMEEEGAKFILYTMRDNKLLAAAEDWFKARGVELWGVNCNPEQHQWTASRKVYAHMYIDDAGLGCPLIRPNVGRPYVNWSAIRQYLERAQIVTP